MSAIDDAIEHLRQKQASMRCSDMKKLLESLGFEVTDATTPNHKLVYHGGIPDFQASNYDCGHGRNPEIKTPYVKKMRRLIENNRSQLATHLGIKNE